MKLDTKRRVLLVIALATAGPWLITVTLLVLFTYAYQFFPHVVLAYAATCHTVPFSLSVLFAVNRRRPLMALAMMMLVAAVLGSAGGIIAKDSYMHQYWEMRDAPSVGGLDPLAGEHNSSLATAGQLTFVDGTFVDDRRTLGYVSNGEIYCVAPVVRPPSYASDVRFWAAGVGCCEMRSNFVCDSGAPQTGAFVTFRVRQSTTKFLAAAREAQSVFNLLHRGDEEMHFVMSRHEASSLEDDLLAQGIMVAAAFAWSSLILYFTMSVVLMRKILHASAEPTSKLPPRRRSAR